MGVCMLAVDYESKKSIREAFGKKLEQLGGKYSNIVVLDADLSASTQTKYFAKAYPERFFDVGIAEQNLITTAAGLSLTGKVPFATAFAVFITGRAYDQIRTSVCYQHANVKIIGTHGGITVGEDGATHQALEDISLMRGLPNMNVIVPSDCRECEQAVEYAVNHQGPVYIRIARNNLPDIYEDNYIFNPNRAIILKEGCDITLISNGDVLQEVCKASEILAQKGINAEVISVPVVKPLDKDTIIKSIKKTGLAVTVENHSIYGGLGSAVCESVCEEYPAKIVRIGMDDCFGQSGTASELIKYYGLDSESIANRIVSLL
ncbi:MAG: transketolase family protein [bacterium]|nr:transketolase family protein [bacterium]